jgi:hypothetical protein
MNIELIRQYHEQGTNGELFIKGKKICNTIELPWKDNRRRVSCIPEGSYKIRKRYTTKFGWHCLVEDVSGRDGILVHSFNDALKESKGCIAPVLTTAGPGVGFESRAALRLLMMKLEPAFKRLETIFLIIKKQDHEFNTQKSTGAHAKVL